MSRPLQIFLSQEVPFILRMTASFILLKVFGFIDYSWIWIVSPLWVSAGVLIVCTIGSGIMLLIPRSRSK